MAEKDTAKDEAPNGKPTVVELSGNEARVKLEELMSGMSVTGSSVHNAKPQDEYKFWKTQPVPSMDAKAELESLEKGEPIEVRTIEDIPKKPFPLIDSFEWCDVDVTNDKQLEETYRLLNENYVEDGEAMFRFDYSREFLRWALLPPGWKSSWHVGVRVKSNKKLVAFITGIPATISVYKSPLKMVEINFLCVHKKLRSKRLAPVLIREITRRVNLENIWQAVYTAGTVLPRPTTSSRYYHRSLNPKKLIEIGFSRLQPRMTMARTLKLYSIKNDISVPGIRELRKADVPAVCSLLAEYNSRFDLHVEMNEDELAYWLLPRDGVIYSFVVEDPTTHRVTDLVSFYSLPSTVMKHPTYKTMNAAYSYCVIATKTNIVDLMRDALVYARKNDFDVFNALELGRNDEFLKELKFHAGDGKLHFYLYNWKCRPIEHSRNSLVLL